MPDEKVSSGVPTTSATLVRFEAAVVYTTGHGESKATYQSGPARLITDMLVLMLRTEGEQATRELVEGEIASYVASAAKPRRQVGDIVRLSEHAGFGGAPGLYRIDELGDPDPCMMCKNPECQEWPNLERLDADGKRTGEYAYHVSECQMLSAN